MINSSKYKKIRVAAAVAWSTGVKTTDIVLMVRLIANIETQILDRRSWFNLLCPKFLFQYSAIPT